MRLKDYAVGRSRRRLRYRRNRFLLAIAARAPTDLLLHMSNSLQRSEHDVCIIRIRSRRISAITFNVNFSAMSWGLASFAFAEAR